MSPLSGGGPAGGRDLAGAAAIAALAAWFAATVLSQHPRPEFNRLAVLDGTGAVIPNWRFFAPEPARHDFHVLFRTEDAEGRATPWEEGSAITPRRPLHILWFPSRRREKALYDLCHELVAVMRQFGGDLTLAPAYRMLRNSVARTVSGLPGDPPRGFQFVVARHTGHDPGHDPDYLFVSPYIPYSPDAPYA
ncbi:hypothetical protein [Streptomyces sp. NBC_00448]|uniref:hypothetical protein n=1 Tax=Streptomyces sp. NBC_00448 TaxID=2903652 RepID=UPI002E1E231D